MCPRLFDFNNDTLFSILNGWPEQHLISVETCQCDGGGNTKDLDLNAPLNIS